MTTIHGMTVDEGAIAAGIYGMMNGDYRAALAFGMLPAPMMGLLEKQLGQKFDQETAPKYDQALSAFADLGGIGSDIVADLKASRSANRKEFVAQAMRAITQAMYSVAPMVV
jgi:hypothetical protein